MIDVKKIIKEYCEENIMSEEFPTLYDYLLYTCGGDFSLYDNQIYLKNKISTIITKNNLNNLIGLEFAILLKNLGYKIDSKENKNHYYFDGVCVKFDYTKLKNEEDLIDFLKEKHKNKYFIFNPLNLVIVPDFKDMFEFIISKFNISQKLLDDLKDNKVIDLKELIEELNHLYTLKSIQTTLDKIFKDGKILYFHQSDAYQNLVNGDSYLSWSYHQYYKDKILITLSSNDFDSTPLKICHSAKEIEDLVNLIIS